MKIMSIDPGTVRAGYAVFEFERPGSWRLEDAAVVRAPETWALWDRVPHIGLQLRAVAEVWRTDRILIEDPGGRSHCYDHGGASLIGMGVGVGAIVMALYEYDPDGIPVGTWTRRRPKERRVRELRIAVPEAARFLDKDTPTHEIADAIGLGLWWMGQKERVTEFAEKQR